MGYRPKAVTINDRAVEHLVAFCQTNGLHKLFMVADRNTYAAQGEAVETALRNAGLDLKQIVFTSEEVIADAAHVLDVLVAAGREPRTYLAVGAGTLTDITRFVSHRTGAEFISVPTAPSVDGFASIGAPLIIHGVKITVICHAPLAIFADINTLAHAPRPMIAAGFADMLGKLTSIADWRIGHLLWNEPYDELIAQRTLAAVKICTDNVEAIAAGSPEGIGRLMDALLESGYCMLDFGSSRPASGAEHHYSHYWEMKLLREGRPAVLHGAKVGVATVMVAEFYDKIRRLSRAQVSDLLEASVWPTPRRGRGAHPCGLRQSGRRHHRRAQGVPRRDAGASGGDQARHLGALGRDSGDCSAGAAGRSDRRMAALRRRADDGCGAGFRRRRARPGGGQWPLSARPFHRAQAGARVGDRSLTRA